MYLYYNIIEFHFISLVKPYLSFEFKNICIIYMVLVDQFNNTPQILQLFIENINLSQKKICQADQR